MVYQPSPRLGRRVSFASDNREVMLLSLPVPRTHLRTKERKEFVGANKSSTHDSSYKGVRGSPWGALPFITAANKETIHGCKLPEPNPKLFDTSLGQPLFWAERKSVAL